MLEKGFILGASHDGIVYYRKNKNEYGLEIEQKSAEWLEIVQRALEKAYSKKSRIRKTKKGYYRLNVYSKSLYIELLKFRTTPKLILEQPEDFQKGFLQGIFDAEGSIRKERSHITVSSNQEDIIEVVKNIMERYGFKLGKPWKDKNNVISIPLYGKESMKLFSDLINFRHPEKLSRLKLFAE